jgi:hypothetical protein
LGRALVRFYRSDIFFFCLPFSNYETFALQIFKFLLRDAKTSESSSELRTTTAPASRFRVSSSRSTATPASGLTSENQTSRRSSDRSQARSDTLTALDTHTAGQKQFLLTIQLTLPHQPDQPDPPAPSVANLRALLAFSMV